MMLLQLLFEVSTEGYVIEAYVYSRLMLVSINQMVMVMSKKNGDKII